MAFRLQVRDNVKRFHTRFTEIRPRSSSMHSRISSKSSGVKTPFNTTDITWDCRNTLTNTAALQSLQSKSSDDQELSRPIALLTNKDSTERIHYYAKEDTHSFETDPDVYGIDVILLCFGQCRCQNAWMDGATSCSWVCVCECTHVHLYIKSQRFWTIYDKHTSALFGKQTFLLCSKLERKATS